MDLSYTAEEEAFRTEVRDFVRDNLDPGTRRKVLNGLKLTKADQVNWQRALGKKGWLAPHWPKTYGGTGWTPIQHSIFDEEAARGGAPPVVPFGLTMCAPVLIAFGNEAQKKYYLPRMLSSEDWWCQGFSEPGAGSDLASLKTRAVLEGNHFVVNGQKTWTTLAQHADMIFCLVRTDPAAKKQEGISFLLINMKSPGITVRPIVTIDGGAEVNEVFFDDVKVPAENLVGEINKGWTYAKYLLGYERTGIAGVGRSKQQLRRLKEIAAAERVDGGRLIDEPQFRARLAALEIELMALEITNLRVISEKHESKVPGPGPSILKVKGTEVQQALTELLMEALGPYAMPFQPEALGEGWNGEPMGPDYQAPLAATYFNWRKVSIYGGSNEIQKNILAKLMGF